MASLSPTFQYSLYWSGHSSTNHFDGQCNNSFLTVWESGNFSISATRIRESESTAAISHPPGQPGRFDGRLRSVSIYFKFINNEEEIDKAKIVGAGVIASQVTRSEAGHLMKSHKPLISTKPGSFWAIEESQIRNTACIGNSKFLPGCLNSTDQPDNSSLTIIFPVGVESRPHGFYSDGVFSVLATRFRDDWDCYPDYNSSHQNFVLLLVRTLNFFIFYIIHKFFYY